MSRKTKAEQADETKARTDDFNPLHVTGEVAEVRHPIQDLDVSDLFMDPKVQAEIDRRAEAKYLEKVAESNLAMASSLAILEQDISELMKRRSILAEKLGKIRKEYVSSRDQYDRCVMVVDTKNWTPEQRSILKELDEVDRAYTKLLYANCVVRVRLSGDTMHEVFTFSHNNTFGGLVPQEYDGVPGLDKHPVHRIPYCVYKALMDSYTIHWRDVKVDESLYIGYRKDPVYIRPPLECIAVERVG